MDEVRIDFDRDHLLRALEQRLGQGSLAGADFDHERNAIATSSVRDAIENRFTNEEMLPELARHSAGSLAILRRKPLRPKSTPVAARVGALRKMRPNEP